MWQIDPPSQNKQKQRNKVRKKDKTMEKKHRNIDVKMKDIGKRAEESLLIF